MYLSNRQILGKKPNFLLIVFTFSQLATTMFSFATSADQDKPDHPYSLTMICIVS